MESLNHTRTLNNKSAASILQLKRDPTWNVYVQNMQQILNGMYTYETNEKFLSTIRRYLMTVFHKMNSF